MSMTPHYQYFEHAIYHLRFYFALPPASSLYFARHSVDAPASPPLRAAASIISHGSHLLLAKHFSSLL
jgi:hypothetical protein